MLEEKKSELLEEELDEVAGGKKTKDYTVSFSGPVDKYSLSVGTTYYFEGEGNKWEGVVKATWEKDDGCGTVRTHRINIVYDFVNKHSCNEEREISGDTYNAYSGYKID